MKGSLPYYEAHSRALIGESTHIGEDMFYTVHNTKYILNVNRYTHCNCINPVHPFHGDAVENRSRSTLSLSMNPSLTIQTL